MTQFLTRLAARALELTPTVQPRVTSVFDADFGAIESNAEVPSTAAISAVHNSVGTTQPLVSSDRPALAIAHAPRSVAPQAMIAPQRNVEPRSIGSSEPRLANSIPAASPNPSLPERLETTASSEPHLANPISATSSNSSPPDHLETIESSEPRLANPIPAASPNPSRSERLDPLEPPSMPVVQTSVPISAKPSAEVTPAIAEVMRSPELLTQPVASELQVQERNQGNEAVHRPRSNSVGSHSSTVEVSGSPQTWGVRGASPAPSQFVVSPNPETIQPLVKPSEAVESTISEQPQAQSSAPVRSQTQPNPAINAPQPIQPNEHLNERTLMNQETVTRVQSISTALNSEGTAPSEISIRPIVSPRQPETLLPAVAPRIRETPNPQPREQPPTSTIHVTIGRIEVRAIAPPPPPTRTRTTAQPVRMKLDDYLRSRNGGRT